MEEKQKRIGIMGGAFDPIHYGHLLIAENAAAQYHLDEVHFMPTGQPPHKKKQKLADAAYRCEMIRLAIKDNPCFTLSRLEINAHEVNYTYLTLERIQAAHPGEELFFILGGDSLKDFRSWKNPERILKAACVLAAVRDDIDGSAFQTQMDGLNQWYGKERIFPLITPNFSVSSRNIRKRAAEQGTIRYMLPEPVRDYIFTHQLYQREPGQEDCRQQETWQ